MAKTVRFQGGGPGSIAGQETRSCVLKLKDSECFNQDPVQPNKFKKLKKKRHYRADSIIRLLHFKTSLETLWYQSCDYVDFCMQNISILKARTKYKPVRDCFGEVGQWIQKFLKIQWCFLGRICHVAKKCIWIYNFKGLRDLGWKVEYTSVYLMVLNHIYSIRVYTLFSRPMVGF